MNSVLVVQVYANYLKHIFCIYMYICLSPGLNWIDFYIDAVGTICPLLVAGYYCVIIPVMYRSKSLQWRHNESDGVSNHRHLHCLLNCLFRRIPKKTSKLIVTGLCEGNSPVPGEFPAQKSSNAENVSIWWMTSSLSLHLISSSGTRMWTLWVSNLHMSCSELT